MRYFANKLADFVAGSRVTVDKQLWTGVINSLVDQVVQGQPPTFKNCDGGLYVGCAGVAYMLYYLAQAEVLAEKRQELLTRARNYTDVALSYAGSKHCRLELNYK